MKQSSGRAVWSLVTAVALASTLASLLLVQGHAVANSNNCSFGNFDGVPCDDGVGCTYNDVCVGNGSGAYCQGTANNSACDDGIPCTSDSCSLTLGCVNEPNNSLCDDGVDCTVDTCSVNAGCVFTPNNSLCDDGVVCTVDTCNPPIAADIFGAAVDGVSGCQHVANASCDDGDGVPAGVEDGVPSASNSSIQPTGDGNGDGVLDSLQGDVTSLPSATGNGYITLVTTCQNQNVQTYTEASVGNDKFFDYPWGLIGFVLPCSSAEVTVIFHGATDLSMTQYRKFGPTTPGDPSTAKFYTLPGVIFTNNSASFMLTDGVLGDDTGVDNFIVDQGGVAVPAPAGVPIMSPLALGGAVVLLVGVGLLTLRRWRTREHPLP